MLWRGTSHQALSLGGPIFVSTLVVKFLFSLEYIRRFIFGGLRISTQHPPAGLRRCRCLGRDGRSVNLHVDGTMAAPFIADGCLVRYWKTGARRLEELRANSHL
jgi:hypothetical protein